MSSALEGINRAEFSERAHFVVPALPPPPKVEASNITNVQPVKPVKEEQPPSPSEVEKEEGEVLDTIHSLLLLRSCSITNNPEGWAVKLLVYSVLGHLPVSNQWKVGIHALRKRYLAEGMKGDKEELKKEVGSSVAEAVAPAQGFWEEIHILAQEMQSDVKLRQALEEFEGAAEQVKNNMELQKMLERLERLVLGDASQYRERIQQLRARLLPTSEVAKELKKAEEVVKNQKNELAPEVKKAAEEKLKRAKKAAAVDARTGLIFFKKACSTTAAALGKAITASGATEALRGGQVGTLVGAVATAPIQVWAFIEQGKALHKEWQRVKKLEQLPAGGVQQAEKKKLMQETALRTATLTLGTASFSIHTSFILAKLVSAISAVAGNVSLASSAGAASVSILPAFYAAGLVVGSVSLAINVRNLKRAQNQRVSLEATVGEELKAVARKIKSTDKVDPATHRRFEVLARFYKKESDKVEKKRESALFGVVLSGFSLAGALVGLLGVILSVATLGIAALVIAGVAVAIATTGYIVMRVREKERKKRSVAEVLAEKLGENLQGYVKEIAHKDGSVIAAGKEPLFPAKERLSEEEWEKALVDEVKQNNTLQTYVKVAVGYKENDVMPEDFFNQADVWCTRLFS